MFGLIHHLVTHPGQRDRYVEVLRNVGLAPGCLSLVIAHDPSHPDALWLTVAYESEDHYRQALELPHLHAAVVESASLLKSFDAPATTRPVLVLP